MEEGRSLEEYLYETIDKVIRKEGTFDGNDYVYFDKPRVLAGAIYSAVGFGSKRSQGEFDEFMQEENYWRFGDDEADNVTELCEISNVFDIAIWDIAKFLFPEVNFFNT